MFFPHSYWTMPAAMPKVSLDDAAPTPEELKAARAILSTAGKKEIRSKLGSMASWLKSNPEIQHKVKNNELMARHEYLEKFIVLQTRAKQSQRKLFIHSQQRTGHHQHKEE